MSWEERIAAVRNIDALLDLLNEYIRILPAERALIPPACRPLAVRRTTDVHRWHRLLEVAVARAETEPSPALVELSTVFLLASARLYELELRPGPGSSQDDDAVVGPRPSR